MELEKVKRYYFTITMSGIGDTPDEAWEEAVEGFVLEPGAHPEDFKVEEDYI